MSKSQAEELIGTGYLIASILSFGFGFSIPGWLFLLATVLSFWTAINHARMARTLEAKQ